MALPACEQSTIRFHRSAATEQSDTITRFSQSKKVGSNAVSLSSWDYKSLLAKAAESSTNNEANNASELEIYERSGDYRYTDIAETQRIARARRESLAIEQQHLSAESSARSLASGTWFVMTDHYDANGEYVVMAVTHEGSNNLTAQMADFGGGAQIEQGTYRNRFTCPPKAVPVRPSYLDA